MILYFSGTGNSRFAAEVIENRIHDTCINAFDYIKNGRKGDFHSAAAYVFVSPTYSWRLPRLFEKFLKSSRFSGCKKAYFVMTCGSEIGNSEPY
ncbi:MAG TPA: flavodoxin domain-containing protein [Candidatus Eubacterium faecale]|uniref:Flavodoxin domain-containing protein n=1 Tax=Candidatus Eubacterium faecale TaxID=2838568 RepID=A0A9D2S945_9FIRM|nr:flavodoxin domain-containing protein [Candidatus Eubacterium faecale]